MSKLSSSAQYLSVLDGGLYYKGGGLLNLLRSEIMAGSRPHLNRSAECLSMSSAEGD